MRRVLAGIRRRIPRSLWWRLSPIRLSWLGDEGETGNFGDQLSPHLIRQLFGVKVIHSGMPTADLVSTGSLLDWAESAVDRRRPIIWGSGFIADGPAWRGAPTRVRAVRGDLSRRRMAHLSQSPIAVGDPGLLTARAFPHLRSAPTHEVGLIPHYTDREAWLDCLGHEPDLPVIDLMQPWQCVIGQLTSCRSVISSSLHGLIVAESYGIPNHWASPGEGITGGRYKFDDYYSAFGVTREPAPVTELLDRHHALTQQWAPLPDLPRLQAQLLRAFPLSPRNR